MRECPDERRAEEILQMRKHIRSRFTDVRMRSDIIKALWTFVHGVSERMDSAQGSRGASGSKKRKSRRKEASDSEGDDGEYQTQPKNTQMGKRSKGKNGR